MRILSVDAFNVADELRGVQRTLISSTSKGALYKRTHSDDEADIGYLIIKPDGSLITYNIEETALAYGEIFN